VLPATIPYSEEPVKTQPLCDPEPVKCMNCTEPCAYSATPEWIEPAVRAYAPQETTGEEGSHPTPTEEHEGEPEAQEEAPPAQEEEVAVQGEAEPETRQDTSEQEPEAAPPVPEKKVKQKPQAARRKLNRHYKLNSAAAEAIREEYATGEYSQRDLAKLLGVSQVTIHNIVNGLIYKSAATHRMEKKQMAVEAEMDAAWAREPRSATFTA